MNPEHNNLVAITVGHETPIAMVLRQPAVDSADSGFSVLFADAPEDAADVKNEEMQTICVHCLIEEYPEVGRGLDLATQHGSAERYPDALTGEWVGRDPQTGEWFTEEKS